MMLCPRAAGLTPRETQELVHNRAVKVRPESYTASELGEELQSSWAFLVGMGKLRHAQNHIAGVGSPAHSS